MLSLMTPPMAHLHLEQGHLRPPEKENCNDVDVQGDLVQEMLTWNGDHLNHLTPPVPQSQLFTIPLPGLGPRKDLFLA